MSRSITQYRVFIGSPGGLQAERERFRSALEKFSRNLGSHYNVTFEPVGWEDAIGGVGRPQELINEDLKQCDYAVFVLHDRWGSPTGSGHTSGTAEEWVLAEELYKENKLRNIALFFKNPDPGKLSDPGAQLAQVLAFKSKIESEKRYLFKSYEGIDEFFDALDGHLAQWLKEHERLAKGAAPVVETMSQITATKSEAPTFSYWVSEARKILDSQDSDGGNLSVASFFSRRALDSADSDMEWAQATNIYG
jgi:hypothetical protein